MCVTTLSIPEVFESALDFSEHVLGISVASTFDSFAFVPPTKYEVEEIRQIYHSVDYFCSILLL